MPDERCRVMRRRLARREQLVRAQTRSKNEVQAVLQRRLQGRPPCSDLFGVKGRQWLAGLQLPGEERESVDAAVRHIEFLDREIAEVERLIAQQALAWPEIRRLMTIPGVNLVCAASLLAAIGSADRFLSSRRLVAYLGLDPKVRQSGDTPARSGRISKRGSASARWALVEAAWSVVLQPGPLHAFYESTRGTTRSRQSNRRDRAQARDPLLVPTDPRGGLRPPATLADQTDAAPPRAHRRRPQEHAGRCRQVGHQPADPRSRARTRPPSRSVLQAHGPRLAVHRTEEGGRERDTGARTGLVTQRGQGRAAGSQLQTPALCHVINSRPHDNLRLASRVNHPDANRLTQNPRRTSPLAAKTSQIDLTGAAFDAPGHPTATNPPRQNSANTAQSDQPNPLIFIGHRSRIAATRPPLARFPFALVTTGVKRASGASSGCGAAHTCFAAIFASASIGARYGLFFDGVLG
jgi:hypothetical protein